MESSGVVWHTQGSGKSLTMVFLARVPRARIDLEDQLGDTATLIGGRVNVIESRQALH